MVMAATLWRQTELDELTNTYYTVEQYQALFSEFLASHPEIRGQLDS